MHTNRAQKTDWAILLAASITAGVLGMAILAGAATGPASTSSEDNSRLISEQNLPGDLFACNLDESAGGNPTAASPEEASLFSALREDPSPSALMAAAQFTTPHTEEQEKEAAEARAHGARTPVRTIRDTAPTYMRGGGRRQLQRSDLAGQTNLWQYLVQVRSSGRRRPRDRTMSARPKRTVRGRQDVDRVRSNRILY